MAAMLFLRLIITLIVILFDDVAAGPGMRSDDVHLPGTSSEPFGKARQLRGSPGAKWGVDLVEKVLAKLVFIFDKPGRVVNLIYPQDQKKENPGYECMDITPDGNTTEGCSRIVGAWPSAKKYLRMGFHDCFKYADGTGGCDGCMNFKGMFQRYQKLNIAKRNGVSLPEYVGFEGDTNNLALSADVLEKVYTDPAFPGWGTPVLSQSLQAGGQSRADLWALATLLAAQYGFKANEDMCAGKQDNNIQKALHAHGRPYQCSVNTGRRLTFESGRADCVEMKPRLDDSSKFYRRRPYETEKMETQGNNHWDGKSLQNFMAADFGFTPRETVAIMGAHSFASFTAINSMFAYEWKRATGNMLNNEYYQLVALRPHLNKQMRPFAVVGSRGRMAPSAENGMLLNETGGLARSRWLIRRKNYLVGGGPWQWSHQYERCAYCKWDALGSKWVVKEPGNGGSKYFRSERCCSQCALNATDENFDPKCLAWVSQDEEALSVDAGLYLDFSFDPATGRPRGCGLTDSPGKNGNWWKGESPNCGKQEIENPSDGKKMYEIVEEYADNQKLWAADFIAALEKMLSNGADTNSLIKEYEFPEVSALPSFRRRLRGFYV